MIDSLVASFQQAQDVSISASDASEILELLSFLIKNEEIEGSRINRLPHKLSHGDAIGEHFFVPMTCLDCSISLALDKKSSLSGMLAMNMSRCFRLSKDNLVICKIKKDGLKYKNFKSLAVIENGIPNFRARCVSVSCKNDNTYHEIDRFIKNRNFNIEINRYREEDLSSVHKFSFATYDKQIEVDAANLGSALKKIGKFYENGLNPIKIAESLLSVSVDDGDFSKMMRYVKGGNKEVHIGSKVVAKPSNMLKSKCVGTVIGKRQNIIKVQWDAGSMHYDLDNPKTYFLIEFVD
jgi:hypothetical protein